jgi:DNA repair ATPase RecN
MSSAEPTDKVTFNYTRISHPFQAPLDNFTKLNYQFLTETEKSLIKTFKEAQDQTETNVFMEIDFDKFLDDLNFHIVSYEDFSSFKDPTQTKQLLYEMKSLTENVLQNVEANFSACENLQKINVMKSKITEQNQDARQAFAQLESTPDFPQKVAELSTLFVISDQIAQKYGKLIVKIKQFELYFCQDIDALHESLSKVDAGEATFDKIKEVSQRCSDALQVIVSQLSEVIDLHFVKEDSKLVG